MNPAPRNHLKPLLNRNRGRLSPLLVRAKRRSRFARRQGFNFSRRDFIAGDKAAYKSINKLANEAYGKTFFLQLAMACSSLWSPACALAWLQSRFSLVRFSLPFELPGVGHSVAYPFVFLPLYILTRILFGKIRRHLPLLGE